MRVFGIDCGTECTGYGVVEMEESARMPRLRAIAAGGIMLSKKETLPTRLARVYAELTALIALHAPAVVAIEDVFFSANAKSALKLGQVRGVALLAAANMGLPDCRVRPVEREVVRGGLRAGEEGAGAVHGGAAAGAGARARAGGRCGCTRDCDLPHPHCADTGATGHLAPRLRRRQPPWR